MQCVGRWESVGCLPPDDEVEKRSCIWRNEEASRLALLRCDREQLHLHEAREYQKKLWKKETAAAEEWEQSTEAANLRIASHNRGVRWQRVVLSRMRTEKIAYRKNVKLQLESQEVQLMAISEAESRLLERRAIITRSLQKQQTVKRCIIEQSEDSAWGTILINESFCHGNAEYFQRQRELIDFRNLEALCKLEATLREGYEREGKVACAELQQYAVDGHLEAIRQEGPAKVVNKRIVKGECSARETLSTYENIDRIHLTELSQQQGRVVLSNEEQSASVTLHQYNESLQLQLRYLAEGEVRLVCMKKSQASSRAELEWEEDQVRNELLVVMNVVVSNNKSAVC